MSKKYWTTMEDLRADPEVEKLRKEEFRAKPQEYFDAQAKGGLKFGRRDFMKWSTGALALASTACARKPTQKIIPYAQQPPEITPGVPVYYASTCRECSAACGIVLTTHEGRPTKVEGNPLHPLNRGTVCPRGQASLHNLYDPDRLRSPVRLERVHSLRGLVGTEAPPPEHLWVPTNVWNEAWNLRDNIHPIKRQMKAVEWLTADLEISHRLMAAGNRAVLLTGTIHGPARTALLADFLGIYAGMRRVVYDSINQDALAAGQQAAYGAPAAANTTPRYFYDRAEMVVTFGDDPIGAGISRQEYSYGFGHQRKVRDAEAPGRVRMSRVVVFEPALSLVGNSADTRYLIPPSQLLTVAMGLAHQLVLVDKRSAFANDATVAKALQAFDPATVESQAGLKPGTLATVAGELWQQRGKSIVRGGGMAGATEDAAMLETAAAFLNSVLGNEGATVDGTGSPSLQAQGSDAAMLALVDDMNQGKVDTLLVYGSNPAYTLPGAVGFLEALAKVPHVYVVADRLDETAQLSDMVLPLLHGLESWGDAEPQAGLYSIVQPTIEPLFGGRSFEDVLINLAYLNPAGAAKFKAGPGPVAPVAPPAPAVTAAAAAVTAPAVTAPKTANTAKAAAKPAAAPATAAAAAAASPAPSSAPVVAGPTSFYDYLKAYWRTQMYPKYTLAASFDDFWTGLLQEGVFDPDPKRQRPGAARTFKPAALAGTPAPATPAAKNSEELELALVVNPMMGDGWWANNALLQEIPDPVSKNCWDNFFTIAPSTAKRLGLEPDDKRQYAIAEVTVGSQKLQAPVFVQVGVNPGVATIAVGFGRESVGQIGTDIGANAYALGQIQSGPKPGLFFSGAKVKLTKQDVPNYLLASPQGNNYIDFNEDEVTPETTVAPGTARGERIIRETDLVQLQANPRAGNPEQEAPLSLWDNGGPSEHAFPNYHWGMTIDLNSCIGCNACVAACYAENNVPVVGKDQVWRGRDMAWIRIDRYFSGDEDNPDVTQQPMLCQQCANAGCESVCPVIATITDAEGINVQVYNRCVGTRFCSNNCIYKVRKFNFFNYGKVRASPLELALNPMVTMRSKGVMEKCNFCTQRIHAAHYKAKERGLPVEDGDIKTACQQTCPSEAIYFGNMNDPNSKMMQARTPRGYRVLEDMNYEPSIHYLTKIRNLGQGTDTA
ncbi:MAG TPA: TAT-variant-translocated molybdopterin oxidoreductase [Terriglobales bacterium]|jgi:molybdopterin-containing oxidoreductase family iron-sulfur binding subunit